MRVLAERMSTSATPTAMSVRCGIVGVMVDRFDRMLERSVLRPVLDAAADLFLGFRCVGCDTPGRCWCSRCARTLSSPAHRSPPDPAPPGLPEVWSVGVNAGPVATAVIAHKERGQAALVRPLGAALGAAMAAALRGRIDQPTRPLIVPVPTTRAAVRNRGYDPLLRIIRQALHAPAVRALGLRPRLLPALEMMRSVADQTTLGSSERRLNLMGAFAVRDRYLSQLRGAHVVVADDLVTTGATLVEASRALVEAGAAVPAAAVVAATARNRPGKTELDLRQRVPSGAGSG